MFRGRPHRGYPRNYPPRGPAVASPPRRSRPPGPYRDDRDRERQPFHPGFQGHAGGYRRSPPARGYPSPDRGGSRGPMSEFRGGGPSPREHPPVRRLTPSPPPGGIPIDHSLVITVGNELTFGSSGRDPGGASDHRRVDPRKALPPEHFYEREEVDEDYLRAPVGQGRYPVHECDVDFHGKSPPFSPRPEECSRGGSQERDRYRKPSYLPKDAKRPSYELEPDERGYSTDRSRYSERTVETKGRSRSRGRSHGRSHSCDRSRGRSRSRSRGKSRGRSRSRSQSRGRSRGRSRSKSRARSRGHAAVKSRCRSRSSSRGSPSASLFKDKMSEGFRELELARRRKEKEELERLEDESSQHGPPNVMAASIPGQYQAEEWLPMPKKSILKKRIDPDMDTSLSIQGGELSSEASLDQPSSNLSKQTERFLNTLSKGMESGIFCSLKKASEEVHGHRLQKQISKESCSYKEQIEESFFRVNQEKPLESASEFLLPHERVSQDGSGFSRILGMMGEFPIPQEERKGFTDIEDEEKFLYGDEEDDREPAQIQSLSQMGIARQQSQPETGQYGDNQPGAGECQMSQVGGTHQRQSKNVFGFHHHLGTAEDRTAGGSQSSTMHRQQSLSGLTSGGDNKAGIAHALKRPDKACSQQGQAGGYPPGASHKDAKEGDAETPDSQEYEKIQNLLKTIGLDIGMAEIGKLAARTHERLHGKKPPAGSSQYAERRQDRSWDKPRSRSSSSSQSHTRSPDLEYGRVASPPPAKRASLTDPASAYGSEFGIKAGEKTSWGIPVLGESAKQPSVSVSAATTSPTASQPVAPVGPSPAHSAPLYSQYQHQQAMPNYPLPGYDQYGNYIPYMPPRWPMYPPPSQGQPVGTHQAPIPVIPPVEDRPLKSSHPYLRVIETVPMEKKPACSSKEESALVQVPVIENLDKKSPDVAVGNNHQHRAAEEKNNAKQKQKVLEEREKLRKDREARVKKKEYLMKELERLRKQQGELLRKKRREKDGHKDPLLAEVGRLQEEVMAQISAIRKEQESAEKKRAELDKVALILGLHVSDKHRKEPRDGRELPPEKRKEKPKSPEKSSVSSSSGTSLKEPSSSKPDPEKQKAKSPTRSHSSEIPAHQYEYYDAGNHWCKNCNTICGSMFDFFTHMHSKTHRKTQDPYDRPWAPKTSSNDNKRLTGEKIIVPAKGSEFLIPVIGFYCQLCEDFFGDQLCAEDHVTCHSHNEKYKQYVDENPLYEQRRNLDRQAGLAVVMDNKERRQTELKRKMEEDPQGQVEEEKKEKGVVKEEAEEPRGRAGLGEKTPALQKVPGSPKVPLQPKAKKKSEEPSRNIAAPAFGKFSWKKSDKDEESAAEAPAEAEDSGDHGKEKDDGKSPLGKSKTIEIKLSGKTVIPPSSSWVPLASSPPVTSTAKIRPNLPAPAMLLRKTSPAAVNKPAPLNTFLSIRPSGSSTNKPLPVVKAEPKKDVVLTPDLISKAFGGEEVVLKSPALADKSSPVVADAKAPTTAEKKSPAAAETKTPSVAKINVTSVAAPSPPAMRVMSFESDVAAPGVPESEQTLTVLVRPPPLHKCLKESVKKSDKPRSSLAAAKAQDLYDIFYSSTRGPSDLKFGSTEGVGAKESKNETSTGKLEAQNEGAETTKCPNITKGQLSKNSSADTRDITGSKNTEAVIGVNNGEEPGTQNTKEPTSDNSQSISRDKNQDIGIQSLKEASRQVVSGIGTSEAKDGAVNSNFERVDKGIETSSMNNGYKISGKERPCSVGQEHEVHAPGTVSVETDSPATPTVPLTPEIELDTLRRQEGVDPLETSNWMSSDASLFSINDTCEEDNFKNQEQAFLEASDLHDPLELSDPTDEPGSLKLGEGARDVPVDLGIYENPALSLEASVLNLESYELGFETADLSVPEPETDVATSELQNAGTAGLGIGSSEGDLCPSSRQVELNILDSVSQRDIKNEMHGISSGLILDDIDEAADSIAAETDTSAITSSQAAEPPKIADSTAPESLESEGKRPIEFKPHAVLESHLPRDDEHSGCQ